VPGGDAEELTWLLFRQEEVISLGQALRHLSRKAIRHRVASGRWRQVHRAVFVAHNGPIGPAQLRWIAVLAGGPGAMLGGLTAAQAGGLRGFSGLVIHLLLPAARRRDLPQGVLAHRTTHLPERDILAAGQPRRTTPARSIVDAAQWARTDAEARAIVAAGFQQRVVYEEDLREVIDRMPRLRRRKLILAVATDAAGGAHSLAELDFLSLVRRAGLPEPTRQKIRYDATGRRRYLDAYFEEWKVHVEIDGGQHLDPRAAWADMRRQNDLWIEGDRILRFPSWAVRAHPAEVIAQLRTALRRAGWPG
jgi:very-short-patch-repair endonuclease